MGRGPRPRQAWLNAEDVGLGRVWWRGHGRPSLSHSLPSPPTGSPPRRPSSCFVAQLLRATACGRTLAGQLALLGLGIQRSWARPPQWIRANSWWSAREAPCANRMNTMSKSRPWTFQTWMAGGGAWGGGHARGRLGSMRKTLGSGVCRGSAMQGFLYRTPSSTTFVFKFEKIRQIPGPFEEIREQSR